MRNNLVLNVVGLKFKGFPVFVRYLGYTFDQLIPTKLLCDTSGYCSKASTCITKDLQWDDAQLWEGEGRDLLVFINKYFYFRTKSRKLKTF